MAIPALGAAQSLFVNPTGVERPGVLAAQEAQEASGNNASVAVEAIPRSEERGDASADLGSREDAGGDRRNGRPGSLIDISV